MTITSARISEYSSNMEWIRKHERQNRVRGHMRGHPAEYRHSCAYPERQSVITCKCPVDQRKQAVSSKRSFFTVVFQSQSVAGKEEVAKMLAKISVLIKRVKCKPSITTIACTVHDSSQHQSAILKIHVKALTSPAGKPS